MENDKNKIAIVTGGASGIGFAIAQKFVENKITTIIIGRDAAKLNAAKNKLGELCKPLSFDLNNLSSIPEMIHNLIKENYKIDILVNNAGINLKKDFTEVTDDEFERVMLTNVTSMFAVSREVVKFMMQTGTGSIINISSMASHYGIPKVIAYTA